MSMEYDSKKILSIKSKMKCSKIMLEENNR